MPDQPIITFESVEQWHEWLQKNHATQDGIFFRLFKKGSGEVTFVYQDVLDEALCFGLDRCDPEVLRRDLISPEIYPSTPKKHLVQTQL